MGVQYHSNINELAKVNLHDSEEAIEITESQYQKHVDKSLSISRYKWEKDKIVENTVKK